MAAEELRRRAEADAAREAEGRRRPGKEPAPVSDEPDATAPKNFTDPESPIMPSRDGFVQAYNAQAAVDARAQIIVAHAVVQTPSDPATSFVTCTAVLPTPRCSAKVASRVATLVHCVPTTSTSGTRNGGLHQCVPIPRARSAFA